MGDGLRLALTTLTVLRVRGPQHLDRRTAAAAMSCAPAVGLLLGLLAAGLLLALRALSGDDLLPAVAAVAALAALTRGLHLDGLADLADGLGSYAPPERAREIMKDPGVGALGLVAVVLTLGLQVAALAAAGAPGGRAVLLAALVGRVAVTGACTARSPAATPGGLGALVAGTVPEPVAAGWAVLAVAIGAVLAGPLGALAVLLALGAAELLRWHAVRRVGGVTGDVLGALVEVATTAVLLVLAL